MENETFEDILVPSDEFVEDLDVLLHLVHLNGLFGVEYRKWRYWGTVIDIAPSRLEETANEYDFEKSVCIFKEFKLSTSLRELCCK